MNRTTSPPGPPLRRLLAAALVLLATVGGVLLPSSASALQSTGHGIGYLWKGDNVSWLGTYRLADSRLAFCLEAGKSSPIGNDYDLSTGSEALGLSADDVARLAYISRKWAASTDPTTAAAGQLAVWTITGLNGHTQNYYAGRANEHRGEVLAKANAMLAEAGAKASIGVSGELTAKLGAAGSGTVRADLVSKLIGSSSTRVPADSHTGTITLTGGVFADGTATKKVKNGRDVPFRAVGTGTTLTVKAAMSFTDLPYGRTITIGGSAAGSQMLLFATKPSGAAATTTVTTGVSPRPFQPQVRTQTTDVHAEAGQRVSDRLHLDTRPGDGLLDDWGVYLEKDTTKPVPVTVRSALLGPFSALPEESETWPVDPPTVCTVSTVVTTGPGDYTTPACELPETGYFVWVETIDPADTPADKGRDRIRPWKSPFASATEVALAPWTPSVRTTVESSTVTPGTCVTDQLIVDHVNTEAGAVEVESLLLGPFAQAPADGHDFAVENDLDRLPVAGRVTTTVKADGEYDTPCIRVDEPGHYVFVYLSEGSEPESDGFQVIPPFADLVAHDTERFSIPEPAVPETHIPEEPRTPDAPAKPVAAPHRLAFTGSTGVGPTVVAAAGALGVGLAAVVGTLIARGIRRRRAGASSSAGTPFDDTTALR